MIPFNPQDQVHVTFSDTKIKVTPTPSNLSGGDKLDEMVIKEVNTKDTLSQTGDSGERKLLYTNALLTTRSVLLLYRRNH
ncbi:hypothetical protein HCJ58_08275 [Listeria sp. FSL L7-1509]|nr:hypothetical protein [Listeria immobilis]MBC6312502.1 hypothetical protein [Listeria immobilis]